MDVLNKASMIIGIAPITNQSIMDEIKISEANNKIDKGNNCNEKNK